MAGRKKASKTPRPALEPHAGVEALQLIGEALAGHEAAIRQLAEVVVNLHANIRALREVADALADGVKDRRVAGALQRLRRLKLDE